MAEWEEKIFFGQRIFLQEGRKVLKVVFLLEIWREGGVKHFFSRRGFFTEKGSGFKKSSLPKI